MKLIVAGTRDLNISPQTIIGLMDTFGLDLWSETGHEIVSGEYPGGVDEAAKQIQKYIGVTYKGFPADWETYGKPAGPIRNRQMAEYADALLVIWDGQSSGSFNMKTTMKMLGKPVYEVIVRKP